MANISNLAKYFSKASKTEGNQFVTLGLDMHEFFNTLSELDDGVQDLIKDRDILQGLGNIIINESIDYIPYKQVYQLRDPASKSTKYGGTLGAKGAKARAKAANKALKDEAKEQFKVNEITKARKKKSGRDKLDLRKTDKVLKARLAEIGWTRVSPSDAYYHMSSVSGTRNYMTEQDDDLITDPSNLNTYFTEYHTFNVKTIANQYTRKTRHDRTTEGKLKARKLTRTTRHYYANRPPHLNDYDYGSETSSTHKVYATDDGAHITIHNKKPKDPKFRDQGGKEYAQYQYFVDGSNFDRAAGGTSRWIEVMLGLQEAEPESGVKTGGGLETVKARFLSEVVLESQVAKYMQKKGIKIK